MHGLKYESLEHVCRKQIIVFFVFMMAIIKRLSFFPVFVFLLTSCQNKENVLSQEDEHLLEIQALFSNQKNNLVGKKLSKTVVVQGESSTQTITMDSVMFSADLTSLENDEISKVFGPASYDKSLDGYTLNYKRREGLKTGPTFMRISKSPEGTIAEVEIAEANDNFLFSSGTIYLFRFENDLLVEYRVRGIQKIIALDATMYTVSGEILPD